MTGVSVVTTGTHQGQAELLSPVWLMTLELKCSEVPTPEFQGSMNKGPQFSRLPWGPSHP